MMSGLMSKVWAPHTLPVRPKPQITSSQMNRTSYFFSTAWILAKYPLGGISTPPAPITGSAMNAATVSGPSRWMSASRLAARRVENASSLSPGSAKL